MKQAYLIIAHKDDLTFRTLISMLDNENNDIFIHMDKKSKNYDEESIEKMAKKSIIYHTIVVQLSRQKSKLFIMN